MKYIRYLIKNYLFALIALIFCVAYWLSAKNLPEKSITFPKAIFMILIPLFFWNGINSLVGFRKTVADKTVAEADKWHYGLNITRPKLIITLATLAYMLMLPVAGFILCTLAYLATLAFYLGIRKPVPLILFAVLFTAVVYAIFVAWLQVRLPQGIIF